MFLKLQKIDWFYFVLDVLFCDVSFSAEFFDAISKVAYGMFCFGKYFGIHQGLVRTIVAIVVEDRGLLEEEIILNQI